MARAKNIARSTTPSLLKQPVNPTVRGTAKQADHEDKGTTRDTTAQSEGTGQRRAGGRGGHASTRKR